MKSLLCATLAVLLVAAVTAQSSQHSDDASAIQELIEKINTVVGSLGGFEGTINKLEYITKLVEKAYNDDGIGGWMARNLIKLELSQLKEKALNSERDMINHLLDRLESKAGLKTYSLDLAENYLLSESVKKAIALIRESIQQIVSEISKAQKEHDQAAGKIGQDAMNKINEHLRTAKEKLKGLTKKLLDKLTGRDKTAEVYGADGGIRYQALTDRDNTAEVYGGNGGIRYQVSSESYILSEMIRVAAQQLRERIFKYIELIGEAKRAAQKELGKHRETALEHLKKLNERLRQAMADLRDTLLGKKSAKELEEEIKEGDDVNEAVQLMSLAQTYGADDAQIRDQKIKDLIKEAREKILRNIKQLEDAKRLAEELLEEKYSAEDRAAREKQIKDWIEEIRRKILENIKQLENAKRVAEQELAKGYAIQTSENYVLDGVVKELVGKLRVKIMEVIEELGKAKREAEKAVGDARKTAREHLRKLRQQLRKLTKDLRDAIIGRKNKEELEKDLEPTTEAAF